MSRARACRVALDLLSELTLRDRGVGLNRLMLSLMRASRPARTMSLMYIWFLAAFHSASLATSQHFVLEARAEKQVAIRLATKTHNDGIGCLVLRRQMSVHPQLGAEHESEECVVGRARQVLARVREMMLVLVVIRIDDNEITAVTVSVGVRSHSGVNSHDGKVSDPTNRISSPTFPSYPCLLGTHRQRLAGRHWVVPRLPPGN
ncbi:hypothetical protein BS17DRAFT_330309 [Gyrodon lividus]|nr:hypothetical protein BS17DRAFT_330309 [Gyrodon lividus]